MLRWFVDAVIILAAAAVYSLGVHCFISPNGIAPGGVTGIAVVIAAVSPVKVGTLIFALNIPLMIVGFIFLNKSTMIKTIFSVLAITIFTDIFEDALPVYDADGGNGIMAALFGGA
ncbi:MAG: YitT family protein, partial [Oscillospiraceae bacterium]|nr:YitT family protein [Oscillospiraceae bacterium]